MKLAEALIERANRQRRLEELKARIVRNAKVQEGDKPAEEPLVLLEEYDRVAGELLTYIRRINATNAGAAYGEGMTLTDAIAERDVLRMRQKIYNDLASAATPTVDRYSRSEVRYTRTVDVAAIQKQADALARQARELDARLQAMNWTLELVE
jgi:hypothetical protein